MSSDPVGIEPTSSPTPPFVTPLSRPLSEISDNSDRRRSIARSAKGDKGEKTSRPNSEVWDTESSKRLSAPVPLHTITVNVGDYATVVVATMGPASAIPSVSVDSSPHNSSTTQTSVQLERPLVTTSAPLFTGPRVEETGKEIEGIKNTEKEDEAR